MPELPEVEITTRKLQPLVGRTIADFWNDRAIIAADIRHRRITRIHRLGKAIVFELSGEKILAFHQRMSGRLLLFNNPTDRTPYSDSRIRARIFFSDHSELCFKDPRKFGVIWYGKSEKVYRDNYFRNLGPDALYISKKDFIARLKKRRGMIKALLLNQSFLAGVGNIIADETLWAAKIHPKKRTEIMKIAEITKLYLALQSILKQSIRAQGTTLRDWGHPDGQSGGFQNLLRVYGKADTACPRCRSVIQRILTAGRGTHFCPTCQQLPTISKK